MAKLLAKEFIATLTVDYTMEALRTIKCMVRANIHGQTEESTLAHMKMTRSQVRVNTFGPMVDIFKENGAMAKEMDMARLFIRIE